MHSIMYEVARQRIADQQRAAVKDGEARVSRAAARARRRARNEAAEPIATPAIPDYPHELLAAAGRRPYPRSGRRRGAGGTRARAGKPPLSRAGIRYVRQQRIRAEFQPAPLGAGWNVGPSCDAEW